MSWYGINGGDLVIKVTVERGWLATLVMGQGRVRSWRGNSTVWHDHRTGERADTLTELELGRLAKLVYWGRLDDLKVSASGAQTTTTRGFR